MQEGGKLASKKPVGTEGNTKVFEGKAAFRKTRILKDTLLHTVSNSSKIYEDFPALMCNLEVWPKTCNYSRRI